MKNFWTFLLVALGGIALSILVSKQMKVFEKRDESITSSDISSYPTGAASQGIVEALGGNVEIGVPRGGIVSEVFVKEGDRVTKNQALFKLNSESLKLEKETLHSKLMQNDIKISTLEKQLKRLLSNDPSLSTYISKVTVAQATLEKYQNQLERLSSVTDSRAVSHEDIKNKRNDIEIAKGELLSAKSSLLSETENVTDNITISKTASAVIRAEISEIENRIQEASILSPENGTILKCNIKPGEFISVTPRTPAIIMGDITKLQVKIEMDSELAVKVTNWTKALAYLKGEKDSPFEVEFLRIEPFISPKKVFFGDSTERIDSRALTVVYTFTPNPDYKIYVGSLLYVFIQN